MQFHENPPNQRQFPVLKEFWVPKTLLDKGVVVEKTIETVLKSM
jgi:hypothetical protein